MKKLLLAAVALLFAVGVSAQVIKLRTAPTPSRMSVTTPPLKQLRADGNVLMSMDGLITKQMGKAPMKAAAPDGEQREYLVSTQDDVSGLTSVFNSFFPRYYTLTFVYAPDGKTVYFNNPLYASYFEETVWLKGELNAAGTQLTVQPNQFIGQLNASGYGMVDCYLGSADASGRFDLTTPIVFDIMPDIGLIYSEDALMCLMGVLNGTALGAFTYEYGFQFMPLDNRDLFDAPVTRKYTATELFSETAEENTVEDIYSPMLDMHFIKGLLPQYPEGWMVAQSQDNGDLLLSGGLVVDDGVVTYFSTTGEQPADVNGFNETSTFVYGADGSYTQTSGEMLLDYFSGYDNLGNPGYGSSVIYTDIKLGAPTPSGISSVTTDKEPVATEYYDLSGRRVDAAAKGVTIRVEKYADGTRKAVKTIK